jgi:2,3-diketo-5-methylthio-1-phosphopentane phosphatase
MAASDSTPALKTNPKFIFFTDFDGTITLQDSNDYLTDNLGYGQTQRRLENVAVLEGRRHFRDIFFEMLESVHEPFDKCIEVLLQNITLDPYFVEFYAWCRKNNVPIVILSGGMEPIIRAILTKFLGEEGVASMQIVSNNVEVKPGKSSINEEDGWQIVYHDDRYVLGYHPSHAHNHSVLHRILNLRLYLAYSGFGHDKSMELRKYSSLADRPIMFYAGDGVSDLSAAKETDLLFAKAGKGNNQSILLVCRLVDEPR